MQLEKEDANEERCIHLATVVATRSRITNTTTRTNEKQTDQTKQNKTKQKKKNKRTNRPTHATNPNKARKYAPHFLKVALPAAQLHNKVPMPTIKHIIKYKPMFK